MTVVVASTVLSDSSPSGSEDSTWNAAVIDPPMFATAGAHAGDAGARSVRADGVARRRRDRARPAGAGGRRGDARADRHDEPDRVRVGRAERGRAVVRRRHGITVRRAGGDRVGTGGRGDRHVRRVLRGRVLGARVVGRVRIVHGRRRAGRVRPHTRRRQDDLDRDGGLREKREIAQRAAHDPGDLRAAPLRLRDADEGRAGRDRVGQRHAGRGVRAVVVDPDRVREHAARRTDGRVVRLVDDEVGALRERGERRNRDAERGEGEDVPEDGTSRSGGRGGAGGLLHGEHSGRRRSRSKSVLAGGTECGQDRSRPPGGDAGTL